MDRLTWKQHLNGGEGISGFILRENRVHFLPDPRGGMGRVAPTGFFLALASKKTVFVASATNTPFHQAREKNKPLGATQAYD